MPSQSPLIIALSDLEDRINELAQRLDPVIQHEEKVLEAAFTETTAVVPTVGGRLSLLGTRLAYILNHIEL